MYFLSFFLQFGMQLQSKEFERDGRKAASGRTREISTSFCFGSAAAQVMVGLVSSGSKIPATGLRVI